MRILTNKIKRPEPTEAAIQAAIVERLAARSWVVVRVNGAGLKNEGGRYVPAYNVAGFGSSGFPDLMAYHADGRFLLIECKKAKGTLTESQERFHAYAAARGVKVHVLRHPDELEPLLTLTRERDAQEKTR